MVHCLVQTIVFTCILLIWFVNLYFIIMCHFCQSFNFMKICLHFCGYAPMLSTDWWYNGCIGTIIFAIQKWTNVLHTSYCLITELVGKQADILFCLRGNGLPSHVEDGNGRWWFTWTFSSHCTMRTNLLFTGKHQWSLVTPLNKRTKHQV